MAKVLILSSSQLYNDPRILRQIRALRGNHVLYTCGLSASNMDGIEKEYPILFRPSKNQLIVKRAINFLKMKFRAYDNLTWDNSVLKELDYRSYNIIIVNDPREMPLALALQKGKSKKAKIYFDLHEWWIDVEPNHLINDMFLHLTDKYYHLADIHSTVCGPIAKEYSRRYRVKEPYIIKNAGPYQKFDPTIVDNNKIKLVHHGTLNKARKLETMIDMFEYLDSRFELTFYLAGTDLIYKQELIKRASKYNAIQFLPPVKFEDIVPTLNQYDIGVYIMNAPNLNHEYALPNKMFEFIQARLALAISPNVAMKALVEEYENGIVSKDYSAKSFAKRLNNLTKEDIIDFKNKSDKAARVENDEAGILTIKKIIEELDE
jgi:glycosyltransferase involved in cell wall biosynthesis